MKTRRTTCLVVCMIGASLCSAARIWAQVPATPVQAPPVEAPPPSSEGTRRQPGEPLPPTATPTGFDFGSYQRKKTEVRLHMGLNRLDSLYQFEKLDTPPRGLGPPGSATVLDRPRFVASLKLTQLFGAFPGAKVSLYGELHLLPSGEYIDPT